MLINLFETDLAPTTIFCDNQSCIKLSKNPVIHDRSKHIEIRYHFIKDKVQKVVIAQFVARIKDLRFEGQTGVTGTNPTQCHHNGMVLSI
jgi:hypothetical protein